MYINYRPFEAADKPFLINAVLDLYPNFLIFTPSNLKKAVKMGFC